MQRCVQNAACVAAGLLRSLPPAEAMGTTLHQGTCMAATVAGNLPEDVLKELQHFSVLLAVSSNHFLRCESMSSLMRSLDRATQSQRSLHACSCDAPVSTRGAEEALSQQPTRVLLPERKMHALERDACRSILLELHRCACSQMNDAVPVLILLQHHQGTSSFIQLNN
jgi:hypothetical protein